MKKLPETLCILPWIHYHVSTHGEIKSCCVSSENISTLKDISDVDSIINHENFNKLRLQMLNGEQPNACRECYTKEKHNFSSMRLRLQKNFKHCYDQIKTNSDGSLNDFNLKFYDIRPNKICNLKCRMCSGYFSSRLAIEEKVLWNKSFNFDNTLSDTDIDKIHKIALKDINDIEKFYFAGGEPLLMKEHYQLLNKLIETNNTNKKLNYNTNLTKMSFKGNSIFPIWDKFEKINLGVSIDAIGERAMYQRHGCEWSIIEENLLSVQEKAPHVKLNITSVLSVYNSLHLQDVQIYLIEKFNIRPDFIQFNLSFGPDYIDIRILPEVLQKQFIAKTKKHINKLQHYENSDKLIEAWGNTIDYLKSSTLPEKERLSLVENFKEFNTSLDIHRNEQFLLVYPELAELYNSKDIQ